MISPAVSVIIPVKDGAATIGECVRALRACKYPGLEIIVVDDGSSDGSGDAAARAGAHVIANQGRGVSAARNTGARAAGGDYLVFTDADVYFNKDTLDKLMDCFRDPAVDGAVGVFSEKPCHGNFASVYKNAWMRFTYMRLEGPVALFFTSMAAVRKEAFFKAGGFDERYVSPGVEDTEFGRRLAAVGARIMPCAAAEARHCKKYSVASLLLTDFRRTAGLVRILRKEKCGAAKGGGGAKLSAPLSYGIGAVCAAAGIALLVATSAALAFKSVYCPYSIISAGALFAVSYACATPFLGYMLKAHGIFRFAASIIFWPVDGVFVTAGAVAGVLIRAGK